MGRQSAWVCVLMAGACLLGPSAFAATGNRLMIGSQAQWKYRHFERDPKPQEVSTGDSFGQEYHLTMDGDFLKNGNLDASLGVLAPDDYRTRNYDFENQTRLDYGQWLSLQTRASNEVDEDIFFTATTDPQSPINTITRDYDLRWVLDPATTVKYDYIKIKRKDTYLAATINEQTRQQGVAINTDTGPLQVEAEHRRLDFNDQLGVRNTSEGQNTSTRFRFAPKSFLSFSGDYEERSDTDTVAEAKLRSKESDLEADVKLMEQFRWRNRLDLAKSEDTRTGEAITTKGVETSAQYDPFKTVGLEASYRKGKEDKVRALGEDISSDIEESRARVRLLPLTQVGLESGYELTDRSSSSSAENFKDDRLYHDISFSADQSVRLGAGTSRARHRNTTTGTVETDTINRSVSMQYRPKQSAYVVVRYDTSNTKNPSTDSFTKTDTVSSNLDVNMSSLVNTVLRTSRQKIAGSDPASGSDKILYALEFNIQAMPNLRVSPECEIIESSGVNSSDERLYEIGLFYTLHKMDISLRAQDRTLKGAGALDKYALLSDIKYQFNTDTVLSFRFSAVDVNDKVMAQNTYDSKTFETVFTKRF